MQVHFRYKCFGPEGRYRLKSYSLVSPPWTCCPRMTDAWCEGTIDIGLCGIPRVSNVQAVFCTANHMANGDVIRAVTPISHCPWCGEAISVEGTIDNAPEASHAGSSVLNTNL